MIKLDIMKNNVYSITNSRKNKNSLYLNLNTSRKLKYIQNLQK